MHRTAWIGLVGALAAMGAFLALFGGAPNGVELAEAQSPDCAAATASAPPGGAAAAPSPADLPLAAIQVLSGTGSGKTLDLTKTLTTLGKPGVQVAVIARRPQGYFITHVEGTSYPVVNGKVLDAQAHALSDHDVIEIAGVKMEFFIKS